MSDLLYLNLKFKNKFFLKKSAINKPVMELKPIDFQKWVKKTWWEKSSGMHAEINGKILNEQELQHVWSCLYN